MHRYLIIIIATTLSLAACASLAEKGRMEQLQDTTAAFDYSLLRADYRAAADHIDPTVKPADINFDQYKKIKIVDCKTTRVVISEDKMTVDKYLELQYFLVDRNILRSTSYQQQWQYDEAAKVWRMKTGLPVFGEQKD
jgi:hypothetical protein